MRRLAVMAAFCLVAAAQDAEVSRPEDYREWVFLSSGLGMTYGPAATTGEPTFTNVFVKPAAYRAFLETGKWPDATMFVLEVRSADSKASINKSGHYQTGLLAIEAEAKQDGKWSFYSFAAGAKTGKRFPQSASCYTCHAEHAAVDNTFVQFYPTLLPVAEAKGTLKKVAE